MTLVTLLSTLAMVLGLGGILPQLARMLRSRSAGGQAVLGWTMGGAAHASMAYVNFFGFHSALLSASNLIAGSLCATAIVLITVLRRRAPAPAAAVPLVVDDLPTQEFAALHAAVVARGSRQRTCRSRPARPAPARARTTRGAAQTIRA